VLLANLTKEQFRRASYLPICRGAETAPNIRESHHCLKLMALQKVNNHRLALAVSAIDVQFLSWRC
jgi:hypothetical protein